MSANEEDSKKPKAGKGKSKAKCHVEVVLNNNKGDDKKNKDPVDILSKAAMHNAYFICHNVQDLMYFRGFYWEGAEKKGKKGRGKKKR